MAERIIMPKTGMAMEEGVIIEWLKKEGDVVAQGDIIAEIETDKSTMELESDYSGTILKILYPAGTTVPVVKTIAWIGDPGEKIPEEAAPEAAAVAAPDVAAPDADAPAQAPPRETAPSPETAAAEQAAPGGRVKATPAARRAARETGVSLADLSPSGRRGEVREADVVSAGRQQAASGSATPLAARIAADRQIPLEGVAGSGHGGKILKSDIALLKNVSGTSAEEFVPNYDDEYVKLTTVQKITGKRMFQSHSEIPVVTEDTKADVTELLAVRKSLNQSLGAGISINDFVMLAAARALRLNRRMNSSLDGDSLLIKGRINLGMAVSAPRGLLVPVIRDADMYSITGLSAAARDLAQRGRDGKLRPEEMEDGTFTVSNVGMYGVTSFTPIINQPQAGILGVCAVEDQLKMIGGEIENRKIMGLSLTFDHRVVDGAEAAVFLKTVRDLLEAPLTIMA